MSGAGATPRRARFREAASALLALFAVQTDKPDLLQAQLKALSKQIPLLFFIAIVNTLAVGYTHYGLAPDILTVGFPLLLTFGYSARAVTWVRAGVRPMSDADAAHLLKITVVLGPLCTVIVMIWALVLYGYGDAYAQGHVVFYMGLTVIACIFCQMHLRAAALAMTAVTVIPFAIFFIATGRPVFIAIALSMLIVSAGMVYILLTFSRDFRAMIDFQRDALHLANHDSLTGLPNRRLFFASLDEAIARAKAADRRLTLGLIDIDRFKAINDLYGLAVGNRVLIEAARRLRALPGPKILFARIGGDEFTVIAENEGDDAAIQALGARICEALEAPIALPDFVVSVTASIGFAAWPEAAADGEGLLECAAYALDHAKRRQRGRATIFSVEHGAEIRTMAHIERCLRSADFDAEMSLHFQPIVDVRRDRVVAFEALARWVSPTLGRVAPDAFIKVAERSDLINKLTRTLLRAALAEARTWPDDVRISFNLSMRDLTSPEAIAGIVAIVESSGVAPGRLDLEVTETALIQDFETADESLRRLKALGVGISLDDFGTGYSSLSYVQQFPIDKIKIDRSFVREVETKPSCRAIVKSVIDLCRNLKLTCIVEGMETREQVRVLRALGCTTMQGYLFGRPMPANEVSAFLAAREALAPPFAAVS